jgi:hypothetical protein
MRLPIIAALSFAASLLVSSSAFAAPANVKTQTQLGIDISYPQCDAKVPTNYAFGIVGVNGGLATTVNPCLADQLTWAAKATGATNQEKIQLYVNTANPGGMGLDTWPEDNTDPTGSFAMGKYGVCDGSDSLACAWNYGWNRASDDVRVWFADAVEQTALNPNPAAYLWWLDVELENTWKTGKTAFDYKSNIAVLEGMESYFAENKIRTGIYSTAYQWGEITGNTVTDDSNLVGKPNWRPGGASLSTAKQACTAKPLTKNGSIVLTQYISRNIDYNYSCIF